MIPLATTTLHFLRSTDPPDGYEDTETSWRDVAQVAAHVDFGSSVMIPGSGATQWTTITKFQSEVPSIQIDHHFRAWDESTRKTYKIVTSAYSSMFDALVGTLQLIEGIA